MNNTVFVLYAIFYMFTFLCIGIGIYLLFMNVDGILNKLAFLISISLSGWCFGIVRSILADSYNNSMIWRKFSVLGISSFIIFLLYFFLVLTKDILLNKWVLFILYFPSVVLVYLFTISEDISLQVNQLQKLSMGWVNINLWNYWALCKDIFINGILLGCLFLIYQWKLDINDKKKKKDAVLIAFLLSMYLIFSMITRVSAKFYLLYSYQITPVIMIPLLLPVYRILKGQNATRATTANVEAVYEEQFRSEIIGYLSNIFLGGGFLFLISKCRFEWNSNVTSTIFLFLFLGIAIFFSQKYMKNRELKMLLYSLLLSIALPLIIFLFLQDASVIVWAILFFVVTVLFLYQDATIILMTSTSTIITQLFVLILIQRQYIKISDYYRRVGLVTLAVCLAYCVNRIYIQRLNELSYRIQIQDFLFLISSYIKNVNVNLQDKMNEFLELLCKNINSERAYIYFKNSKDDKENYFYRCDKGVVSNEIEINVNILNNIYWKNEIKENGMIRIHNVFKLPDSVKKEKEILLKQKVGSMLLIPFFNKDQIIGFMRFDFILARKEWNDEIIKLLRTFANILRDFKIGEDSEKKMHQMVYYDHLTNIPNRELFGKCINQAIQRSTKNGESFGILLLDLDSFKNVNDTMGHQSGDKVLIIIADRLEKCLRKTDIVCRFGGDEFLILLNGITSDKDIETVAIKIISQFEKPITVEGQEFFITASVGISSFPVDGKDINALIKNADIAMYEAKNKGKNQYVFCSKEMKEDIWQSRLITNHLYHALEKDELKIAYQPQVLIDTGEIIAAEALARWNHPELGDVSPALFIPIAEETGLIHAIGEWALRQSCKQNKIWQDMGLPPIRIAVNVSVKQLLKPGFADKVEEILNETMIEPRYLELEITENIAMQESNIIFDVLYRLKAIGISLAIDDFGIEYSSLNRVKLLPIDRLKIDINFIKGISSNNKDRVIVDVIIKLAKDLHLKVIAEGVETVEQLNYLKQKKCDEVQGYYFYKPLSKEVLEEILRDLNLH